MYLALNSIYSTVLDVCPSCKHNLRQQQTPEHSVDRPSPSTKVEPNGAKQSTTDGQTQQQQAIVVSGGHHNAIVDFFEQKRVADTLDKMCPMCAKMYNDSESFDDFQEHVESHFIDDSDLLDNSLERNYELVSHTVGDF